MVCSSEEHVADIPFVPEAVSIEWMEAALLLPSGSIAEVASKAIYAGGSGIPKCLITVSYAGEQEAGLCREFFCKLALAPKEGQSEAEEVRVRACRKAHDREVGFYRFISANADEETLARFPRCYHASKDVIVLENSTLHRSYEAVSSWVLPDPAPDTPFPILERAVVALAQLHTCFWALCEQPGKEMLSWEELIAARLERLQDSNVGTAVAQMERLTQACQRYSATDSAIELCRLATKVGFAELYRRCLPNKDYASVCHGDSNPGNFLHEAEGQGILLVDFQEPIFEGPGVSDVARLIVSGMAPESRRKHYKELLVKYQETVRDRLAKTAAAVPSLEELNESYLYSLLVDALFIAAVVPGSLLDNESAKLYQDIVRRSVIVLGDHIEDFMLLLQAS